MINLLETTIEKVPVLSVVQADLHDRALPTVIYYHGFNGEKTSSLTLAYKIAEKGYRVVLPDCMYHGARKKEMGRAELDLAFWDVVIHTIKELPVLKEELVKQGFSERNRFAIGGTSMGAIVTYGALVKYDWIKTAAALMGTAYMTDYATVLMNQFNETNERQVTKEELREVSEKLAGYDMSLHPHTLNNRPLFIWHGEMDEVVPYKYSLSFYESLLEYYRDEDKLRFVNEQARAHHVSQLAMEETAAWFEKFL